MLLVIQIILSILIIAAILMQSSGSGLGSSFGGGSAQSYHSRRGFEKTLFRATIALCGLFLLSSILPLFISI